MPTTFFRGLVVDVLTSTSNATVTNNSRNENQQKVTSEAMKNFPRNTIMVKSISEGLAKKSDSTIVCYPFFSSHLCMPIKPGEYVWFVFENPEQKGSIAYWLSRITEPDHVDDVNYTFAARTFLQPPEKQQVRTSDKFDGTTTEASEIQTYSWRSPTSDPTEMFSLFNHAVDIHRFESVPRYTKRPGDLVLQGSNNSLIMLGEERGHWASDQYCIAGANDNGISPGQPAIDIVVGRGAKSDNSSFGATKGKTIVNEFGVEEIDKREKSIIEGDPHFKTDSSRIYLTANSENINSAYHPDQLLSLNTPEAPHRASPTLNEAGAFAVVKSDNLRLVSRDIGSIRVIKEPTDGKINGSAIMMYNDGELQLAGRRITLSMFDTSGATEPYIKQSALVGFLNSLLTDLSTLCAQIIAAGGSLATSANVGGPVPGAQAAGGTLTAAATATQAKLSIYMGLLATNQVLVGGQPTPIGSTVIYGE